MEERKVKYHPSWNCAGLDEEFVDLEASREPIAKSSKDDPSKVIEFAGRF